MDGSENSNFEYDDVFVQSIREGARLHGEFTSQLSRSAGFAYERTFASDITADVNNVSVDDMPLEGNSGVGELSATYQSSPQSAWAAAVALKGYVGARQGAAGQVRLEYRF